MEVNLEVSNWKVKKSDDGIPKIVGTYEVKMNGKKIASSEFNDGYNSVDIPFSADLIQKVKEVEAEIVKTITTLVS